MNRIGEILRERGVEEITPSEERLKELGTTIHTWNKFVANKKDPKFDQVPIIAKFLGVTIEDLFPSTEDLDVKSRHGFV